MPMTTDTVTATIDDFPTLNMAVPSVD